MKGKYTPEQAANLSALQLAFIGDAVYNLVMRLNALSQGGGVKKLHQGTTNKVNAVAQAKALCAIEPALSEEEQAIVKRGRNAHAHHAAPKSATIAQYCASTGFEALIGYLYLSEQNKRLLELFDLIDHEEQNQENQPLKEQGKPAKGNYASK